MDVWLVTSEGACGIAEHSAMLREAVRAADPDISLRGNPASLDPYWFFDAPNCGCPVAPLTNVGKDPQIVHLNYHAALHSRWHPEHVRTLRKRGIKVVITYHDTGVPNSERCLALYEEADAFVVHEPCKDLPGAYYWRQGVPAARVPNWFPWSGRPLLGTVGFPFPWKNYDLIAEATARAGWALLLLAPNATNEDKLRWERLNSYTSVMADFLPADQVVRALTGCDATAFLYNCHNTGTSGAIRQGIAARKPVIASRFDEYCTAGRQFRDLVADPLASRVITWINPDLQQVVDALTQVRIAPIDAGMVALATQDSWAGLGKKYAALYRTLVA